MMKLLVYSKVDSHLSAAKAGFLGNDSVVVCHSCLDYIGINYSRNPQVYKEVDSRLHGNDRTHSCHDYIGINYSRNPLRREQVDSRLHGNDK